MKVCLGIRGLTYRTERHRCSRITPKGKKPRGVGFLIPTLLGFNILWGIYGKNLYW